jgi:hypothetical protein
MSEAIVKKPSFDTKRYYNPLTNTYTTDTQSKNEKGQYTHEITSVAPNSFSKTTVTEMMQPEHFSKMVQTTYSAFETAKKNNQRFFLDRNSLPLDIYNKLIKQVALLILDTPESMNDNVPTIQQATQQQVKRYKQQRKKAQQQKQAQRKQVQRKKAQQRKQAQRKKAEQQAQRKKAEQQAPTTQKSQTTTNAKRE